MATTRYPAKVWVPNLRPLIYYHALGFDNRTDCGIRMAGYGYTKRLAEAKADLCHPCNACFPRRFIASPQHRYQG